MDVRKLDLFGEATSGEVLSFEPEAGNKVFDPTIREANKRLFKGIVYGDYGSKEDSLYLKTTNDHYLSLSRGQYFQISDGKGNGFRGSGNYPYFNDSLDVYPPFLKDWLHLGIMDALYDYLRGSDSNGIEVDLKNLPAEDKFLLDIFTSQIAIYLSDENSEICPYRIIEGTFNADGINITTGMDHRHEPYTTVEFQGKFSTFPVALSCDGNIIPSYDRPDSLHSQLMLLVASFYNERSRDRFTGTVLGRDFSAPLLELARSGILYN